MNKYFLSILIFYIFLTLAHSQSELNREIIIDDKKIFNSESNLTDTNSEEIVIKVCVNGKGKVISAILNEEQSEIKNEKLIEIALKNAYKWTFEESEKDIQCGSITYDFKVASEELKRNNQILGDSLNCSIFEFYAGLNPQIYIDKDSLGLKFYDPDYPQYFTSYSPKKEQSISLSTDTLDLDNLNLEFDKYIEGLEVVSIKDFQEVKLQSVVNIDSIQELYSGKFDFVGDDKIDRISIKTSKPSKDNSAFPLRLELYESNNDQLKLRHCSCNFWSKPQKLYISELNIEGFKTIMFFVESDIPEKSLKMFVLSFSRFEIHIE